ncbi:MAG: carboxypeptidase regulatory-like domain-containing protein [Acidobacteria bacterium]|nr:carboxypeptidase regulatory-like domain-containing protein [Acidobacteriota bacterium]
MVRQTRQGALPLLAALILATLPEAAPSQTGGVTGRIVATGLPTSAGIVVSREAPGPKVTPPAAPVEMDQRHMQFLPHVLPVVRGTTVRFLNNDRMGHNVFSPEGRYDLGAWTRGQTRVHTFSTPGVYTQLCRLHSDMQALVVVLNTPYFATTNPAGAFEIRNVPPGKYTLVAWSEKRKTVRQAVSVDAAKPATVSLTLAN